ncbi:hypothetical protein ACTU45_11955 [Streptomyces sp. 24-1644]|uniref:hypothetical protein n=1 Tax=Streptomyces sp. 24-1644 TaxID=3457315 RepID=UPI003FA7D81F
MPDEEWERFLRESVAGTADAPEEPSARAREVARRLSEEPARPEAWRSYSPARPKRRTGWYAVGLLVVLALLAVAVAPDRVTGWFGGGGGAGGPLAAESERPDQPPPGSAALRATPDEPFRGSPAERWASGTAGISVPTARATGWMSTAQVKGALERTLDFLDASNLEPGVLRGEHPDKAIALINPHQRDVQDFLAAAFRTPGGKNDPLLLFSRFDPSHTRPVGDVVRTRGRMTYREGELGALQVTADVTFVYPVAPAADSDEAGRTIVRRELVLNWDDPAEVVTEPGTFSLVSYTADTTNGGCENVSGYLTPSFGAGRPDAGADGGPEVDPYDRSTSMADRMKTADEGCGTATRS